MLQSHKGEISGLVHTTVAATSGPQQPRRAVGVLIPGGGAPRREGPPGSLSGPAGSTALGKQGPVKAPEPGRGAVTLARPDTGAGAFTQRETGADSWGGALRAARPHSVGALQPRAVSPGKCGSAAFPRPAPCSDRATCLWKPPQAKKILLHKPGACPGEESLPAPPHTQQVDRLSTGPTHALFTLCLRGNGRGLRRYFVISIRTLNKVWGDLGGGSTELRYQGPGHLARLRHKAEGLATQRNLPA
ncbi:IgGFc-binding protein-like [Platysternon megacephalum]|uniref:IgGFc-binding protein-like n=1 Tax=Platysternon megacephalum TaxID=55544 RepID=A0A4D9DHG4_9SAUR|nr:IgGFc-binding protein-like [Platysternon megacephalum]